MVQPEKAIVGHARTCARTETRRTSRSWRAWRYSRRATTENDRESSVWLQREKEKEGEESGGGGEEEEWLGFAGLGAPEVLYEGTNDLVRPIEVGGDVVWLGLLPYS